MTEVKDEQHLENDPSLLLVSGSKGNENDGDYVKKLANAILQVYNKHGHARMRCVGAAAVNNAEKAFIIARGEASKKGEELVSIAHFVSVNFDGVQKTGLLKEVVFIDDFATEE